MHGAAGWGCFFGQQPQAVCEQYSSSRAAEAWIVAAAPFLYGDKRSIYGAFCTQCIFNLVTFKGPDWRRQDFGEATAASAAQSSDQLKPLIHLGTPGHDLSLSEAIALIHVLNCQLLTAFHFQFLLNLANLSLKEIISTLSSTLPTGSLSCMLLCSAPSWTVLPSCRASSMTSRSLQHQFQNTASLVTSAFMLNTLDWAAGHRIPQGCTARMSVFLSIFWRYTERTLPGTCNS